MYGEVFGFRYYRKSFNHLMEVGQKGTSLAKKFSFLAIACINIKYVGEKIDNPWNVRNYGTDVPDYTDPNHFIQGGNSFDALSRNNERYDPEHKLPSNTQLDNNFEPFRSFIQKVDGDRKNIIFDNQAPPLEYPPRMLQNGGRTYHKSDADGSEQQASAEPDYSLFNSPVADGGTSLDGIFAGDAGTDVATTLDPSIFDNAGDTFDLASQGDLGAFDLGTNIASADGTAINDWDSSLASTGVDLFTADNSNGGDSTAGDLAFLGSPDGSTDDSLFSKRSRESPRDFRP